MGDAEREDAERGDAERGDAEWEAAERRQRWPRGDLLRRKGYQQSWYPFLKIGGDLLSHFYAVPSALQGLTSLFGMGRGGTPAL